MSDDLRRVSTMIQQESVGDETTGEVALWRAVITQALMDAGSNSSKKEMKLIKAQAKAWLLSMSRDFQDVCARANLPAEYVRERAKEALARGCSWRAYNPNSYKHSSKKGNVIEESARIYEFHKEKQAN